MSLRIYLEEAGVDDIADDEEFMEAEYDLVHSYCESHGYCLGADDMATIRDRGLEDSYESWIEEG